MTVIMTCLSLLGKTDIKTRTEKIKRKRLKADRPNTEGSERPGSKEKEEKNNPSNREGFPTPNRKTEEEGKGEEEEERNRWEEK